MQELDKDPFYEPPPPIMGTWNRMYCLVLILHAVIILLFYWFTKAYS